MTSSLRLGLPPKKPNVGTTRNARTLPRREVSPDELLTMPAAPVWDIRPYQERIAFPGYIPGSRSVSLSIQDAMALPWNSLALGSSNIVLVCLSGRRSGCIAAELWAAGLERVLQLRGGILEWQASGLALCEPEVVATDEWATVDSLEAFRRAVVACFVAEAVLQHECVAGDEFVSPKLLVERVLHEPGALSSFDQALGTIDLLAENARRLGYPIDRLGVNLSVMRSVLARLLGANPSRQ